MSNRMWENTVEHAKTCVLVGKLYVYYSDESQFMGVVFNQIYELVGLITNGQFLSAESLSHSQKVVFSKLVITYGQIGEIFSQMKFAPIFLFN